MLRPQAFLTGSSLWRGLRVGLFGGSFNPAHDGHLHVAKQAIRRLDLDAVWWLVSPQNPLKDKADMAPLAARLASARAMARHPQIVVTAVEQKLGVRHSLRTVRALQARNPDTRFVWIMGADNLAGLHRWQGWRQLMRAVAIAVIDRPGYSHACLTAPAARAFGFARVDGRRAKLLAQMQPPCWAMIRGPLHRASATALRRAGATGLKQGGSLDSRSLETDQGSRAD